MRFSFRPQTSIRRRKSSFKDKSVKKLSAPKMFDVLVYKQKNATVLVNKHLIELHSSLNEVT